MARYGPSNYVLDPDIPQPPRNALDRYFKISERGSTFGREVRGGLATFFTMAYIVVLNPLIIGTAPDENGSILGVEKVAAVTALVAGVMTLLMGVIGRYPLAIAAGLGLNAFVAVDLAGEMSWADAMGIVVIEGLVVTVLVVTGFRTAVFLAIPLQLKTAISVGIGLFIALIGFVDGGFATRTDAPGAPPLQLGIEKSLQGWPSLIFVTGLVLTAILVVRRVKGAILIGIVSATLLAFAIEAITNTGPKVGNGGLINEKGWSLVVPEVPDGFFKAPDLSLLGEFSLLGSVSRVGVVSVVLLVFTMVLADFFDTMGTIVGVGSEAGLLDKRGTLPGVDKVLLVDSLAAVAGGAASGSSNTTYIESAAGVGEGARTGVANLVTGTLFLLAIFISPLVKVVPFEAASPALVIVGFLMATQIRNINFSDYGMAIPAFLTMLVMPFTYSIANGIGAGFVSYVAIKVAQGRSGEIHWLMWIVSVLFMFYFAISPLESVLGVK